MTRINYLLSVLIFIVTAACADDKAATTAAADTAHAAAVLDRPSFSASHSVTVNAVVEAIDHETRVVTVRRSDGEEITFTVSEEARNLGQVEVGDLLFAEYVESLTVEVMADDGMGTDQAAMLAMARAKEGDMPGFAAVDTRVAIATVEEINIEANTFKLKTPDGLVTEYAARNPDNLRRAMVGDLVVMTVTAAIAVMVEEQPQE